MRRVFRRSPVSWGLQRSTADRPTPSRVGNPRLLERGPQAQRVDTLISSCGWRFRCVLVAEWFQPRGLRLAPLVSYVVRVAGSLLILGLQFGDALCALNDRCGGEVKDAVASFGDSMIVCHDED